MPQRAGAGEDTGKVPVPRSEYFGVGFKLE